VRKYVWCLEEWIIRALAGFGVVGERRAGRVGVWVISMNQTADSANVPAEKKIAAVGVRIRRWVTSHGISINVNPDLTHYDGIVPCGISDYGVTSLAELGLRVTMDEIDQALKGGFSRAFD